MHTHFLVHKPIKRKKAYLFSRILKPASVKNRVKLDKCNLLEVLLLKPHACKVCACSAGYALEEPCNSFHHTACYSIAVFFNLRAKLQFISRTSVAQSTAFSACLMHSWPGTFRPVGKTDGRLGRHFRNSTAYLESPLFTSESGEGHNNWMVQQNTLKSCCFWRPFTMPCL